MEYRYDLWYEDHLKMKQEEFLASLFKQYIESKDEDYITCETDFYEWLRNNGKLLLEYSRYLKEIGFDYSTTTVAEMSKHSHDSLASFNFLPSFKNYTSYTKLILEDDEIPRAFTEDGVIILPERVLMTHNPYHVKYVEKWPIVHNRGYKDISIGVFGSLDDRNVTSKIATISDLFKQMNDDCVFSYDTKDGNYFCTINSKRKIHRLDLVRRRRGGMRRENS